MNDVRPTHSNHQPFLNIARYAFTLLTLLTAILGASAALTRTTFEPLTKGEGLGDLLVNRIHKDRQGYVWLGTGFTLERFDGTTIRTFKFPGDNSLRQRVNSIADTPDGGVYAATRLGLFKVDPSGSDIMLPVTPDEINFPVNALDADDANRLYISPPTTAFSSTTSRSRHRGACS